jgi:hypothetical protein
MAGRCTLIGPGGVGKTTMLRAVSAAFFLRRGVDRRRTAPSGGDCSRSCSTGSTAPIAGESQFDTLAGVITGRAVTIVVDGAEAIGRPGRLCRRSAHWASRAMAPPGVRHQPAVARMVVPLSPLHPQRSGSARPAETVFRQHFASSGGRPVDADNHATELALTVDGRADTSAPSSQQPERAGRIRDPPRR